MQAFQDVSIRRKLTTIMMLTSSVVLLLAALFFVVNDVVNVRRTTAEDLLALAKVIGSNCTSALTFDDEKSAAETLAAVKARPSIVYACIFAKKGNVFAHYTRPDVKEALAPPKLQPDGYRFEGGYLHLFYPIMQDTERVGTIYIQSDMQEMTSRLKRYAGIVALTMLIAIVTAFLLSSKLQKLISKPIHDLADTAKVVSEKENYSIRATKQGQDEIGYLIDRFNEMLAQIEKRDAKLHEINQQLVESEQRALAANRTKSDFLANMSHELRTPLNAIIGFSEVLADQGFGELNQKQARYVNNILTSGRHLLQLINDILDLAKVEAGRMQLDVVDFSVADAIRGVETVVKPLAAKKQIAVTVQCAPDLPIVKADDGKFKQVMYNLFSNAIKYTREGGSVTVTVGVETPTDPPGRFLRVTVTDTGIGIKPEDLERVFGEFEQLDASYARQQEGTGLGLALTRKLVELHGGRIWVESEGEGKGSSFSFRLPLPPEKPMEAAAPPDTEGGGGRLQDGQVTVLVVEDDKNASELLTHYLTEAGYTVAQAFDGKQAIQMARELRPDAITLDVVLKRDIGWEVLNTLKSSPETHDIPVLIVSITEDRQMGMALGAVEVLVKPVNKGRLIEAISRAGAPAGGKPMTVLVVDDEPPVVEVLADTLQQRGYKTLSALSGAQGIEMAIEHTPDIIVLDLMMPEVTGFDVVQRLRENPQTKFIPILVFTAKDVTAEDRQRLDDQVRAIVSKSGKEDLLRELARSGRAKVAS